jgi:hypothetical protein
MLRRVPLVRTDVSEERIVSSTLAKATLSHIQEDSILHSRRCENLKTYAALTGWAL